MTYIRELQPSEKLIPRLDGVIEIRSGTWKARCPAHEDRSPSLSIKEADSGSLLIYCHAGCDAYAIVSAVGLSLSDLFPPDPYIQSIKQRRKPHKNYQLIVERARSAAILCAVYAGHIEKHWEVISDPLGLDERDLSIFKGATEDLMELLRV
jgi:hypothetical protein